MRETTHHFASLDHLSSDAYFTFVLCQILFHCATPNLALFSVEIHQKKSERCGNPYLRSKGSPNDLTHAFPQRVPGGVRATEREELWPGA